jgi:Helix-turn-helix domain of resolvase
MVCRSAIPLTGIADACHEPTMRTPATAIPAPTATESLLVIVFSQRFLAARRFSIGLTERQVPLAAISGPSAGVVAEGFRIAYVAAQRFDRLVCRLTSIILNSNAPRALIKARTGEGRERAKGRGVRFGRPLKLSPHQRREAIERLDAGDTVVDVARTFGVDRATLYRMRAEVSG